MGYAFLAEILLTEGRNEDALEAIERGLAKVPEDPELLHSLGATCQRLERWQTAFSAFERAAKAKSDWGAPVYQYGRTGALSGTNLERAAAAMQRYLDEFATPGTSTHAAAHWRLGMIREHAGDRGDAVELYRRALELNPDLKEAREALRQLETSS